MCTDFLVKACEADFVNGRSMEFAPDLKSKLFFRGPGHNYKHSFPDSKFGYTWIGKYGFVGMNVFDLPLAVDGMNSAGLATGALWLPSTEYQTITDKSKGLSIDSFTDWVLSSFATCCEVADALKAGTVQVGPTKLLNELL